MLAPCNTQSTELNWRAPSSGTYLSPILGYKIQMKQLCQADVSGTSVADLDSNSIDFLRAADAASGRTHTQMHIRSEDRKFVTVRLGPCSCSPFRECGP